MKTRPIYLLLTLLLILAGVEYSAARRSQDRQKARYYYLEGARLDAMGMMPEAHEYFKKAYLTDSTYAEAASEYGLSRLRVRTDTMQSETELKKSTALLRQFVEDYPGEKNESLTYAYIAAQVDTIAEAIRIFERLDTLFPSDSRMLLHLGDAYMQAQETEKALSTMKRFEVIEGKSPQVTIKKIGYMLAMKDTVAAVNEVEELIASNPREPYFHILKGNLYEIIGDNDSVISAYTRAEELNPDSGAAKLSLASFYKNQGDSVAYDRKVYEALLSEDFELEDKLSLLGEYIQNLFDDESDTSRGDHLFEVLMEQYPHEPQLLDLAARYNISRGDSATAIQQIGYAIDQDPTNAQYWSRLIAFQVSADKPRDAMNTVHRAAEHIEITPDLQNMYALAALMAEDYQEAEKTFGELIHSYAPDLPIDRTITDTSALNGLNYDALMMLSSIYSTLGDMYYKMEDLEKTYSAYDNSLLFNPDNTMSLNNYAYFLSENKGDLDKAEKMARQAVEADPENDTYLDTMAWVLFKKGEYKEALEFQHKALEEAEKNGEPAGEFYNHLGDILFMSHQPEEALENWKKALKLDPENALLKKKVTHKTFFFE